MNKQMTAVEWLIDKIYFKQVQVNRELLEQALEMEKQQLIDAFKYAQVLHTMNDQMRGEQYYNETFNK
jgi:hypothetical protein